MHASLLSARLRSLISAVSLMITFPWAAMAQTYVTPTTNNPPRYGPFNAIFLEGGTGLTEKLAAHDTVQMADAPWTLYAWIKPNVAVTAPVLIGGMGETSEEYPRMLAIGAKDVILWDGPDNSLRFPLPNGTGIAAGAWHFVAAAFDGTQFHVYVDGAEAGQGTLLLGSVSPVLSLAPADDLPSGFAHFGGTLEGFTLLRRAMSGTELAALSKQRKHLDIVDFAHGSEDWPIQSRQWIGYRQPQNPQTLPHSKAPFSKPVAAPLPARSPALTPDGNRRWLVGDWYLQAAPKVHATAQELTSPQYSTQGWVA